MLNQAVAAPSTTRGALAEDRPSMPGQRQAGRQLHARCYLGSPSGVGATGLIKRVSIIPNASQQAL